MAEKIYHYPVWIRLWHLANAVLCLILIISGLSMQYSNPNFVILRFDIAVLLHNIAGITLVFNYLIYFIGNIATKNIRFYKFRFKEIITPVFAQMKYYTNGIFKGQQPPFTINEHRKFNPLQQVSYFIIMYLAIPVVIITGLAMLFPETIIPKVFGVSGLLLTDLLHVVTGFIISLFMVVHIYFCTTGIKFGTIFKSMITGWTEVH